MSEEMKMPEWLKDMQVLRLRPGDVIVLRTDFPLPDAAHARINEQMQKHFPENKVLILEEGLQIGVISEADDNE